MSFDKEALFNLLPAFNRIRDQEAGERIAADADGPLKALLGLIAEQVGILEENFEQLYDDQFIETCAEWAVPYIADLIAVQGLAEYPGAQFSQRAQVANTITYRRRKGTASMLEQLARDITGWQAVVVEYFKHLSVTQYLNHLRPTNISVAPLHSREVLEKINTPFDLLTRTADVRNISSGRGKYNIPNLGIFLWRINDFAVTKGPAYRLDDLRYTFDPLGMNTQLYALSAPLTDAGERAGLLNVPAPINRFLMYSNKSGYYGIDKSVLVYGYDNDAVNICNLSDAPGGSGSWINTPVVKVTIDPVLGRIALPEGASSPVFVNYFYGAPAEMGGGAYDRQAGFFKEERIVRVPEQFATIQDAIDTIADTGGIVEVTANDYFFGPLEVYIAAGKTIELRAADKKRPVLVLDAAINVTGGANAGFSLNGFLIAGGALRVPAENSEGTANTLRSLVMKHCSWVPGATLPVMTIAAQPAGPRLIIEQPSVTVTVEKSLLGSIRCIDTASVYIKDAIVDALEKQAVAFGNTGETIGYGGTLSIENTTIRGRVLTRIMQRASNTLFFAEPDTVAEVKYAVAAQRLQEGCVRFCYIPSLSRLPKRYHCVPGPTDDPVAVAPVFNSLKFGDAAYCQLSSRTTEKIKKGADNEAEIGAFNHLYQPQRIANLQTRINEYLRFGLEAGIFFAS